MRANRKSLGVGGPALLAVAALTLVAWGGKPAAQPPAGFAVPEGPSAVSAELIAEHASVQPGGSTRIGVHFELEEGWHIYAEDPGDAGLPTTIVWEGPPWVSFGPLHWPPPQQFQDPGDIRTHGYSGAVVLYSTLQYQLAGIGGQYPVPLTVHATVKWLACKELCIPGSAELDLSLPVSAAPPALSTHAELFDHN